MITDQQLERISQALPSIQNADARLVREFQQAAFLARIPAGQHVFLEGDWVEAIALLISGVVRVYKIRETGRLHRLLTCWTKTPGKCIHRDDMDWLIPESQDADVVVLARQSITATSSTTCKE